MSLRHALLALLTVTPMTGYDLSKAFQASVSHVWHAPDSQIYPELRRMEADGLLVGTEVPWGPRGKKREYHVTAAGLTAFRAWMNEPLSYTRERDPAHLRAAYLEWAEPDAARAQLRAHRANYAERRDEWLEKVREIDTGTSAMLEKRLAHAPASEHAAIRAYKRYTYEGLIARAEHEIEWAERGLALVDQLNGGDPTRTDAAAPA
ncbi:PadR family transcriptional regulator [Cryobacterium luteum]|uniref:PadR family transcriptional regulator n=1 Tax=Cryobacterium luteum TaxID=1424661 RepID=A0A1H8G4U2_9MICO|nr:helix-turn-helix transcriptional regulator [Cryobacterium luteum]TFB93856.1 PadR family transcriptional regulator [Cryobacterium luteum]SEN38780.1 transcriptional regulator, PadR family [Cryobacterium luteum]